MCSLFTQAQTGKQSITGYIKDSLQQKPLAFVTVSLYPQNILTQPIKSTATNDKGWFQLTGLDTGAYTLIISHAGFADYQMALQLGATSPAELNCTLAPSHNILQGVTVTARKPLIEQADDKVTFNVDSDPLSKAQTAIDILRKTPFVSVDGDGNVQVNGQSNFKVLLNGRETAMFAQNVKEALRSFPGAAIAKIEVITSPSAKYDAEGVGGVINIVTKKKVVGYNGSLFAQNSDAGRYSFNANFSAKFGRVSAALNYGGYGVDQVRGQKHVETTPFIPSIYTRRAMDGKRVLGWFQQFGNAEVNWQIDSLNTVSTYSSINGGWWREYVNQTINTSLSTGQKTNSDYEMHTRNESPTKSIGAEYVRKFNSSKEKEFSIRFNAELGNSNNFIDSKQDNPDGYNDRYITNNNRSWNKQYTLQSDYTLPLQKETKVEAGVKTILRRATADFTSYTKKMEQENYIANPDNTNNFEYTQSVHSIYGMYYFKAGKTKFRIGARTEQTDVDGNFFTTKTRVKQHYAKVLPNLQASTKFSKAYTMVLSYNMRLQRPYIDNLNPFVNNNDSLNITYGNSQLDAQTIHNVSVQNRFTKGATLLGLTINSSYSNDLIVKYATLDKATGIVRTTSDNIGEEFQLAVSSNSNLKLNKDWSLSTQGTIRYSQIQNKADRLQKNSGISGHASLNMSYTISKRLNTGAWAGGSRPPVTLQESYPYIEYWYGLGLGYKMFKETLTLQLNAQNIANNYINYRRSMVSPDFNMYSVARMPLRSIGLSINWNFGKLTENVSKKKGVTNDDLLKGSN